MDDEHGGGIYPKDTATWDAATIISRSRARVGRAHGAWTSSGPGLVLSLFVEKGAMRDTTYGHACTIDTTTASLPEHSRTTAIPLLGSSSSEHDVMRIYDTRSAIGFLEQYKRIHTFSFADASQLSVAFFAR